MTDTLVKAADYTAWLGESNFSNRCWRNLEQFTIGRSLAVPLSSCRT